MHDDHISLQEFIILIFSIGTPFCICFYCSMRCLNYYLKALKNSEIRNNDTESDTESDIDSYTDDEYENEILSPRSIRVINKYGHYKPDYSSDSEYSPSNSSTESGYDSENNSEPNEIPFAYG